MEATRQGKLLHLTVVRTGPPGYQLHPVLFCHRTFSVKTGRTMPAIS